MDDGKDEAAPAVDQQNAQRRNERDTPPKVKPRLKAAPKIREMFWCDFPEDAHLPELWKTRPVVILSYRTNLYGAVTVIPCSTLPQDENKWAFKIKAGINGQPGWAICDKPATVAVSRLSSDRTGIRRLPEGEFNGILKRVMDWLPKLPEPEKEPTKGEGPEKDKDSAGKP